MTQLADSVRVDVPQEGGENANAPVKVMVVDDELAGLTYRHFTDLTGDIANAFSDLSSPELEELWSLVIQLRHDLKPLDVENPRSVLKFVSSTELIQDVLLSPLFRANASDLLTVPMAAFLERANSIAALKSQIESAFPAPMFDITYASARPMQHEELLHYDMLILDLVLHNSAAAVDEMVTYLSMMGNVNYPAPLPRIIIMSNSEELVLERLRFSTESEISAAGLLLLPKAKIRQAEFGTSGLVLSYQQLERQRDIAQHMRVFMRTWMKALEDARKHAKTTLWNLDAAAMQQIHLSAVGEDDPYDEHLNELMSREYLWHVESSPAVGEAVEALDACFQDQFKSSADKPAIENRFIAPFVKPKVARDLVSHFTWTGFPVPQELHAFKAEDALSRFNRLVPFGAVLMPPELTPTTQCLVHITQQCDLNAATRPRNLANPVLSAQFAVVLPVEVVEHRMPVHDTDSLVARGLTIDGKEYDLKLMPGRMLALPIGEFISRSAQERLKVVGRLRHDIAMHFLSATTNHMTRFASMKTTRVEVRSAHVILYGKNFPESKPVVLRDAVTNDPVVVQVAQHDKLYFFQDDTSIRLALWIKEQLALHYPNVDIDASVVCNALSVGLRNNQGLVRIVDFCCSTFSLTELNGQCPAQGAPDPKVRLIIAEKPTKVVGAP